MALEEDRPVGGRRARLAVDLAVEGHLPGGRRHVGREAHQPPGAQHAPHLRHGLRVAVAGDVLDHRDAQAAVERVVGERQGARVLDAQVEVGVDAPPGLDLLREEVDAHPLPAPLAAQQAREELGARDVEPPPGDGLVDQAAQLVVAPRVERHQQALEARAMGAPAAGPAGDQPARAEPVAVAPQARPAALVAEGPARGGRGGRHRAVNLGHRAMDIVTTHRAARPAGRPGAWARYGPLFRNLVRREVRQRYKGSVLGLALDADHAADHGRARTRWSSSSCSASRSSTTRCSSSWG